MIFYDNKDEWAIIFRAHGSALRSVLFPHVFMGVVWAYIVVVFVSDTEEPQTDQETENTNAGSGATAAMALVAAMIFFGFVTKSFKRFDAAVEQTQAMEAECLELVRHSAMLLDTEDWAPLRAEVRRVALAVMLSTLVEVKVLSSPPTNQPHRRAVEQLDRKALRRARKAGLLTEAEALLGGNGGGVGGGGGSWRRPCVRPCVRPGGSCLQRSRIRGTRRGVRRCAGRRRATSRGSTWCSRWTGTGGSCSSSRSPCASGDGGSG